MDILPSNSMATDPLQQQANSKDWRGPRIVASVCGAVAMILGSIVLIGWAFHVPMLAQVGNGKTPMAFNTAIGFVFAGLALLFSAFDSRHKLSVIPTFSGVTILLLAGWAISENVFGRSSSLGMTALPQNHAATYWHSGPMAPNAAVAFLCFGLALILYRRVKIHYLATLVRCTTGPILLT
jgi:hypothetical protein